MTSDGFTGVLGGSNLGQHFWITVDDAGKVHHLAQADDAGPVHGFGDVIGCDLEPGGFQTGGGGRTGGHLGVDVDRLQERFVVHQAHTAQAQDVGDLVRIRKHRRRAMGDHGGGELGRGQHARFEKKRTFFAQVHKKAMTSVRIYSR